MLLKSRHRRLRLILLVALGCGALTVLAGCHQDDTPVSPNEKTAAPARLPGEDPSSQKAANAPPGMRK